MSWADAAWIGPTAVALGASVYGHRTFKATLNAERERWSRERQAAIRDRRLETVRSGYLKLMAAAGAFVAAMHAEVAEDAGPDYLIEAYVMLKNGLRDSGGVIDAYGSHESRAALEATRRLVAESQVVDTAMRTAEQATETPPGHDQPLEEWRDSEREWAASMLADRAGDWHPNLAELLKSMREDIERFEAAGDSPTT